MTFLVGKTLAEDADHVVESVSRWDSYHAYLEAIRDDLPPSTREFFFAPWHYDPTDHRCLHDSWLESIEIRDSPDESRKTSIVLRLLGAYHDGHMTIVYDGVETYSLSRSLAPVALPRTQGHGDLLADELSLEDGTLKHHLEFSGGALMQIAFQDLRWNWSPKPN